MLLGSRLRREDWAAASGPGRAKEKGLGLCKGKQYTSVKLITTEVEGLGENESRSQ
jgi:hypothetical protein